VRVQLYSAKVIDKIAVKSSYDFEENPVRIEFGDSYVVMSKRELEEFAESIQEMLETLNNPSVD
jgi:hypothetical protein